MLNIGTVISLIKQYGSADPVVIESAVQDWLDAHPEATTTVADGSITEAKLATTVAQKLGLISSLSDEIADLNTALGEETRNLFNLYSLPEKTGITVVDNIITGTGAAFNSAFGGNTSGIMIGATFKQNTQYTITFDAKNSGEGSGNGLAFIVTYTDNTVNYIVCSVTELTFTHHKGISTSGKTISKIGIGYFANPNNTWNVKNIQVEEGTVESAYIPYLSATDYINRENTARNASDIVNLETEIDQGNAFLKSQLNNYNAINLLKFSINESKDGVTVSGSDNNITVNGTTTSTSTYFDIVSAVDITTTELQPGKKFWFDTGLRNLGVDGKYVIYFDTGNGFAKAYDNLVGVCRIYIPDNCDGIIIRYYPASGEAYSSRIFNLSFTQNKPEYMSNRFADMRFLRAFGTGDSTIIKFSDGTVLVIDFGLNEAQGTLQSSWATAISELGITHIDYAIISHFHQDHVGMLEYGISSLLDSNTMFFLPNQGAFTSEELEALTWVDTMADDTIVESYEMAMNVINTAGCKIIYPEENDTWYIGGAEIKFWNTDHSAYMAEFEAHTAYDYNPCSLCNYITIGAERICFSGDINLTVMENYATTVLPSQIFKVNHHSHGYNVVPLFLNSLMPEVDVAMLGYNLAISTLGSNANQAWCEANFVPNVVTGINQKTLSLKVTEGGYLWNTSCRKCICSVEGI